MLFVFSTFQEEIQHKIHILCLVEHLIWMVIEGQQPGPNLLQTLSGFYAIILNFNGQNMVQVTPEPQRLKKQLGK